ncbi:MAG: cell division protein FtsZ [Deltaproteobacteria bacterium]|nr:MAG: cell division protein FtsZ [Deltaproteobacteria bacterium]
MIEFVDAGEGARIKVVGVGGGGGNAVNTMIAAGLPGVDFIAANTDAQALRANLSPVKVQLGEQLTRGLGAGGNPAVGKHAAEEDVERLRGHLGGADMIFITAGMGGGTGTGAAPVIARVAKEIGSLTVGVVTKPFTFEGKRRMKQAEDGMRELKANVDTLIAIPNQRLLSVAGRNSSILETFKKADDVLLQAVRGISDLITVHGLINLDFADVRTIMSEMGMAMMGAAIAQGENRAVEAAQKAISSPLLEDVSIQGARGVLINITGGPDLTLHEVNEAATLIQEEADDDANIIFGAVIDESMGDEMRITVIATGFGERIEKGMGRHGSEPRGLQAGGRPVRRHGLVADDELDVPTWQRRRKDAPVSEGRQAATPSPPAPDEGDEFEIPTFLRRGAE